MEPLCTSLYDALRPRFILLQRLDDLCELVDILKHEVSKRRPSIQFPTPKIAQPECASTDMCRRSAPGGLSELVGILKHDVGIALRGTLAGRDEGLGGLMHITAYSLFQLVDTPKHESRMTPAGRYCEVLQSMLCSFAGAVLPVFCTSHSPQAPLPSSSALGKMSVAARGQRRRLATRQCPTSMKRLFW